MLQAIYNGTIALAAGDNLPMTADIVTNPAQVSVAENEIVFSQPGIYRVTANAVFSPTAAGESTINGVSGDNPITGMTSTFVTTAADQTCTFSLLREIKVAGSFGGTRAKVGLVTTAAGTLENLVVTVEKMR